MTTAATADVPTTRDIETSLRTSLETIRRAWPTLTNPPRNTARTRHTPPGSRLPTPVDPLSLATEIATDLAYWTRQLALANPDLLTGRRLYLNHQLELLRFLQDHARWASGWQYGERMASEFETHAHDARTLAWPRNRDTMLIGTCPNTIGVDGTPVECGTPVRVNAHNPGDVKCKGCGLTDTIDGWLLRMVGSEAPVTIPQLVPLLKARMGVVVSERTLRRWYAAGRFTAVEAGATPRFDRQHVFTVLAYLDEKGA